MELRTYKPHVIGVNRQLTVRYTSIAVLAAVALLGVYAYWLAVGTTETFYLTGSAYYLLLIATGAGLAGGHAYQNRGLITCIVIASMPWLGHFLSFALFELAYPRPTVVTAFGSALLFGMPIGVVSYLLGRTFQYPSQRTNNGQEIDG